jgi:hypothetical protein
MATSCADEDAGGEILPADEVCSETRTEEVDGFYAINDTYVDQDIPAWEVASPAEVGLDAAELEAAAGNLALSEDVASLLVVRHGKLVFERYFNGSEATHANNVHSLSKSILSAVAGIAVAEGQFQVEDPISGLLPKDLTGDSGDITVGSLLTMAGGLDWAENETEHEIEGDHSHVAAVLARPRIGPSGSEFLYNTGLTQTLSAVLAENVGDSLCRYTHDRLLEPLGIDVDHWKVDPDGYHAGGHSVFLTPREVAVFGQLILQQGVWEGHQLIPSGWLEDFTVTPCTLGNRRSAIRSLATPFCTQKIACPVTPAARSRSSASVVSCVFMVRRTASSARQSISEGSPTQRNSACKAPSVLRSNSPAPRIASSCPPRAMPMTSCPDSARAAATVPPIAPTP